MSNQEEDQYPVNTKEIYQSIKSYKVYQRWFKDIAENLGLIFDRDYISKQEKEYTRDKAILWNVFYLTYEAGERFKREVAYIEMESREMSEAVKRENDRLHKEQMESIKLNKTNEEMGVFAIDWDKAKKNPRKIGEMIIAYADEIEKKEQIEAKIKQIETNLKAYEIGVKYEG